LGHPVDAAGRACVRDVRLRPVDVFRPHQHSPDAISRFAFWVWIGAYTVEPIGLVVFGGSRGLAEAFVGEVEGFARRRRAWFGRRRMG